MAMTSLAGLLLAGPVYADVSSSHPAEILVGLATKSVMNADQTELFSYLDRDQSGDISRLEASRDSRSSRQFSVVDSDANGVLNTQEFLLIDLNVSHLWVPPPPTFSSTYGRPRQSLKRILDLEQRQPNNLAKPAKTTVLPEAKFSEPSLKSTLLELSPSEPTMTIQPTIQPVIEPFSIPSRQQSFQQTAQPITETLMRNRDSARVERIGPIPEREYQLHKNVQRSHGRSKSESGFESPLQQ